MMLSSWNRWIFRVILILISFSSKPASCKESDENQQTVKVCEDPVNILEASRIADWIDSKADPCKNITEFACGRFFNQTVHNDRYRKISKQTIIEDKIIEQRRRILSSNVEDDDIVPFKLAKRFFWICTYTIPIDFRKTEPLLNLLSSLGGWPLLGNNEWREENFNPSQIFKQHPSFIRFLFEVFVTQGSIIRVDRPSYEVKVRDDVFILNTNTKDDYLSYMLDSVEALGVHRSKVIAEMTEAVDFLLSLTSNKRIYKRFKNFAELHVDFPNDTLFEVLDIILDDQMKAKVTQIMVDKNYLNFLEEKLAEVPTRTVANALIWLIVENAFQYLPKRYQEPNLKFRRLFDLTLKDIQRWERCMDYTNSFFRYAVDALYAKYYIEAETRSDVQEFFEQILEDSIRNIESTYWLNQTVLDPIIQNINDFIPIIGFREEVLNATNLIENYKHFWPVESLGDRKEYVTAKYFDPEYRKKHPLQGIQFFELALMMEDRKYLGGFRKLGEPNLLDFQFFFEYSTRSRGDLRHVYLSANLIHKFSFDKNLPDYLKYNNLRSFIHALKNKIQNITPYGFIHGYKIQPLKSNDTKADECKILDDKYNQYLDTACCFYKDRPEKNDCVLPGLELLSFSQVYWIKEVQDYCILDRKTPWWKTEEDVERNKETGAYFGC